MNGDCAPILQLRSLSGGLQKVAKCELNEVPERMAEDLQLLRNWVKKQPHLRSRISDQFLVSFLRGSKYSMEKAKTKLDRYYALRADIPEIFNERRLADDPMVLEVLKLGIILQIPLAAGDCGPSITIIRAGSYDTNKFKFADIVRVGTMFAEIMLMEDDNATVTGFREIMDMSGVSGAHFFQLKPDLLRKCALYSDEALPMRHCGIHFINVPPAFETGFNTLKSMFSAKMLNRISVCSDPETIYNHVPRKYLPVEYGGENGNIKDIITRMEAKLIRYRDYFLEERNYGADENLREVKNTSCTYNGTSFGSEGSFRKLDID